MYSRWNNYRDYLVKLYGLPVYRIGIDGGFSCPNRDKNGHGGCSFCDGTGAVAVYQRKSESGFTHSSGFDDEVSRSLLPRLLSIEEQIQRGKAFLSRRYGAKEFSVYFQSYTNTYDCVDNLRRIYDSALNTGNYKEFIVSTRPDCIPDDVLSLLSSYSSSMRVWVELGLQSANDRTLRRIGRGHTSAVWKDAAERVHAHGLMLSSHVILGLPGESLEDEMHTIDLVNAVHSDGIKIHNLHVPGGTRLADEYLEGIFTVSSEERYLESAELALRRLSPDTIIQRLICETPMHRLVAPRVFPDKSLFLSHLEMVMEAHDTRQGDLYGC